MSTITLSAPASRTSFRNGSRTPRITVSTLRSEVIAEASDEGADDDAAQYATVRSPDDEAQPHPVRIQPVGPGSSSKASPATARLPPDTALLESRLAQSLDRQFALKLARQSLSNGERLAIGSKGELAKMAAVRRIHNRSQSMYVGSPATPPLSPPVFNFSGGQTSPVPFTSALSPNPNMDSFAAAAAAHMVKHQQQPGQDAVAARQAQVSRAERHRRAASATFASTRASEGKLPSLEEIKAYVEKRTGGPRGRDASPEKRKDGSEEEEGKMDEEKKERRASRLPEFLKRRSIALQDDEAAAAADVIAAAGQSAPAIAVAVAAPAEQAPPAVAVAVKPKLRTDQLAAPQIRIQEASPLTHSPIALKRRTVIPTLSVAPPPPNMFGLLPTPARSPSPSRQTLAQPQPPKNLLAMRGTSASGESNRAMLAQRMVNRLSSSSRITVSCV